MKVQRLTRDELTRLGEADISVLLRLLKPENVQVVAVEDVGRIVAHVGVLQMTHFEGLWIDPEYRGNAGVFRALIREAYAIPRERGETFALGGAEHGDARMETLCHRLGGRELPVKFFAIGV